MNNLDRRPGSRGTAYSQLKPTAGTFPDTAAGLKAAVSESIACAGGLCSAAPTELVRLEASLDLNAR
jgi:hypothetical protein